MAETARYDALLAAGELDQARREAEAALKRNASDRAAKVVLARLAAFDGNEAQAESWLAGMGQEAPDVQLVRAALLTRRGDAGGALALYRKVTQALPDRAEGWFGQGYLLADAGDNAGAQAALERAVALSPKTGIHHFHLGRVLFAQERLKEGFEHLQESLRLNPRHGPSYLVLAVALQAGGELDAAEELLVTGLNALPDDPYLLNGLCNVRLARGNLSGAVQVAEALARVEPDSPAAQANLARLRMAQGRLKDALEICRKLASRGQATAQSRMVEAMSLEALEPVDIPAALAAWREAVKLAPDDWAPANNLGNLLMRIPEDELPGAGTQAAEVLEEAHRRAPERPEPVLNLALVRARLGDKDAARSHAKALLAFPQLDPEWREQAERLLKALG
ncbi:tetratricopeptide repeat protein [Myxococcus sp. K15C18031901]|uniref:tetratricopeptide repeat protein n=1 Tax=Myxococcus dinghuensis TaxID=2906761 RepID=UPI0020A72332|nr:tetratricopeptide repeat protein [Myxococcus dinghuensis]MCP3102180.1 tetratricopeptide repeat protein [Myxococcus dinghuensis]